MDLKNILLQTKQTIIDTQAQEINQAINENYSTVVAAKLNEIEEKKNTLINAYAQKRANDLNAIEAQYQNDVTAAKEEAEKKKTEFINTQQAIISAKVTAKYAKVLEVLEGQITNVDKE